MRTLIIVLMLSLSACGGSSESSSEDASKSLFSLWTNDSANLVIDMTGGSFGAPMATYVANLGDECTCSITVAGTESSGTYDVTSCMLTAGSGGTNCALYQTSGTYSNTDDALVLDNGGQAFYH